MVLTPFALVLVMGVPREILVCSGSVLPVFVNSAMDKGKGKIVMATVQLEIETEAFQVNLETKTLIIPRLGLKH